MSDDLKLFNVGWHSRAKESHKSLYFQVGNEIVYANNALDAYNYTMETLNNWHKRQLDWILNIIVFVEEIKLKEGVLEIRETQYGDKEDDNLFKQLVGS